VRRRRCMDLLVYTDGRNDNRSHLDSCSPVQGARHPPSHPAVHPLHHLGGPHHAGHPRSASLMHAPLPTQPCLPPGVVILEDERSRSNGSTMQCARRLRSNSARTERLGFESTLKQRIVSYRTVPHRILSLPLSSARFTNILHTKGGSVAKWLVCWTQAQ